MKNFKIITLNFILAASLAITAYAKQTNIDKTNTQTSDGNAMQIGTTNNNLITNQNLEKQSISELISRYKTMWDSPEEEARRNNIVKRLANFDTNIFNLESLETEQFDLLQSNLLDYYEFSVLFNTKYAFFIEFMKKNQDNKMVKDLYDKYSEFIKTIQPAVQKINDICNKILFNDDYCKKMKDSYIKNVNSKVTKNTAINYYVNNINLNMKRLNGLRAIFQKILQDDDIKHISQLWTKNFEPEQITKNNFIDKNTEISDFTIIPKYEKDKYAWRNDYELSINLKNAIFNVSPCFKINLNILAAVYKMELLKITYYWDLESTKNFFPSEEDYQEFVEYANNLFAMYNSLRCFVMAYANDKYKYIKEKTFTNVSVVWLDYARIKNNYNDIINAFSSYNTDTTSCHQEYYINILNINSIQDFYNHISNNSAYYDNLKNISNLEDLDNFYLQMSQNSSTPLNISNNLNNNNNNIEDTEKNTNKNESGLLKNNITYEDLLIGALGFENENNLNPYNPIGEYFDDSQNNNNNEDTEKNTNKKESSLLENNMSYEDLLLGALGFENENNLGPYNLIGKYATSYNDSKNIPPLTNLNNFYSQMPKKDQNNLNNNKNNKNTEKNTNKKESGLIENNNDKADSSNNLKKAIFKTSGPNVFDDSKIIKNNNNNEDKKINTTKKPLFFSFVANNNEDTEKNTNKKESGLIENNKDKADSSNNLKNAIFKTSGPNLFDDSKIIKNNNNSEDKKINTNTNQQTPKFFNDNEKVSILELIAFYQNMWDSPEEEERRNVIIENLGTFNEENLDINSHNPERFDLLQTILLNYYNFSVLFNAKYAFFFEWMKKNKDNPTVANLKEFQNIYVEYSKFMDKIQLAVNKINYICYTIISNNNYSKEIQASYFENLNNERNIFPNQHRLRTLKTNLQHIFNDPKLQHFSKLWMYQFSPRDAKNNNFINKTNTEINVISPISKDDSYSITQYLKETFLKIFPSFKTNLHVLATAYKMEFLKTIHFIDILPESFEEYSQKKKYANDIFTIYNTLGYLISFFNEEASNQIKDQNISSADDTNIDERWPTYITKTNRNNDIINSFFSKDEKRPSYHEQYYDINYNVKSILDFYAHFLDNISDVYDNLKNISNVEDLNSLVSSLNSYNSNNLNIPNTLDNNQNTSLPADNTKNQDIPSIYNEDDMEIDNTKKPKEILPTEIEKQRISILKPQQELAQDEFKKLISLSQTFWNSDIEKKKRNDIVNSLNKFKELLQNKFFNTKNNSYISSSDFNFVQSILLDYYNFAISFNTIYSPFIALMEQNKNNKIFSNLAEYKNFRYQYSTFVDIIKSHVQTLNYFCSKILFDNDFNNKMQAYSKKIIDSEQNDEAKIDKILNNTTLQKLQNLQTNLQTIFLNTKTQIDTSSQLWSNTFNDEIKMNNFIDENTKIDKFEVFPKNIDNYQISSNLRNYIPNSFKINPQILAAAYKMELLKSQYYMKKLKDESLKDKDQKDITNDENEEDIFKSYEATKTYANDVFKTYNSLRCLMTLDKNLNSIDPEINKSEQKSTNDKDSKIFPTDPLTFNDQLEKYTSNKQNKFNDPINYSNDHKMNNKNPDKIYPIDSGESYKIKSTPALYPDLSENKELYENLINIFGMDGSNNIYLKTNAQNNNNIDNLKSTNVNSSTNRSNKYISLKDYIKDESEYSKNVQIYNTYISQGLLRYYNDIWSLPEEQNERLHIKNRMDEFKRIYKTFINLKNINKNAQMLSKDFNTLQTILLEYYNFLLHFSKYNYLIKILTLKTCNFKNYNIIKDKTEYKTFINNYEDFTNSIAEAVQLLKKFINDLLTNNFKYPRINNNVFVNNFYQAAKTILDLEPNFQQIFNIMEIDKITGNKVLNKSSTIQNIDVIPGIDDNKEYVCLHKINEAPPHYRVNLDILSAILKMEISKWLPYFKQMQGNASLNDQKIVFNNNFTQCKKIVENYINKLYNFYDKLKTYIVWSMNKALFNIRSSCIYSSAKDDWSATFISVPDLMGEKIDFIPKIQDYINDKLQYYTTLYLPQNLDNTLSPQEQYINLFKTYYLKRQNVLFKERSPLALFANHILKNRDIYDQLIDNKDHDISAMKLLDQFFAELDPGYFSILPEQKASKKYYGLILENNFFKINTQKTSKKSDKNKDKNKDKKHVPSLEKNKIEKNKIEKNKIEKNKMEKNKIEKNKIEKNKIEKNKIEKNKNISKNIKNNNAKNSNIIRIPLSDIQLLDDDFTSKKVTQKRARPTSNKKTKTKTKTKLPNNKTIPSLRRSERIKARNSRLKKSSNSTISININSSEDSNIPLEEHNIENTKNSIKSILKMPIVNKYFNTISNNTLTNNNLTNNNLNNNNLNNNNSNNNNLNNNNLSLEEFNNTDNLNQTSLQVQFEPNNNYNNKSEILTLNNQNNQDNQSNQSDQSNQNNQNVVRFRIPIITNTPLPTPIITKNKTSTNNLLDNNQSNKKTEEDNKNQNQSNKKTKKDKKNQNQKPRRSIRIREQKQKNLQKQLRKQMKKDPKQVTSNKNKTTQKKSKTKKSNRNTAKNKKKTNKNNDKFLSKKRLNSTSNNENNTIKLSYDDNIPLKESKKISILKNPNVRQIKPTTNLNNNNNNLTSNKNTNSNLNNFNTSNMTLENANIDNLNQIPQNNQNSSNQEPSNNQNHNNSLMKEEKNEQQNKEQQDDNK